MKKFLRLFLKKNSCACFVGSRLKAIFDCSSHPQILSRYLVRIFAVLSGSEAIEHKKLSSANTLTFDFRLVPELFMYIKKKESPKIDPCGTPARIHSQPELCP